ncbi:hypothetical protein [Granulicella sp. S190]|uniref:hypothetical protein n=1 Tax=Granulicella sp. S190 TaxID=1747226 RepID=UPI00131B6D51|nr:hypothetical protein [Granulicella sp. S190]
MQEYLAPVSLPIQVPVIPVEDRELLAPPSVEVRKEILHASAPFARFTLFSTIAAICLSSIAFVVLDDICRRKAYLVPFACMMFIAFGVSLWHARTSWLKIAALGMGSSLPLRTRRKLAIGLCIAAILLVGGAVLIGAQVGTSGGETESYIADLDLYRSLGDKISAARNGAPRTIEGQVAMYSQIEPDVHSLNLVVQRLETENRVYAAKYPAAQATTASSADAFENTRKRGQLLLQQIAIAKEIQGTQGHDAQLALYKEKMMPVLTAEDHLDGR